MLLQRNPAATPPPLPRLRQMFWGTLLLLTWVLTASCWTNEHRHGGDWFNVAVIEPVIASATLERPPNRLGDIIQLLISWSSDCLTEELHK